LVASSSPRKTSREFRNELGIKGTVARGQESGGVGFIYWSRRQAMRFISEPEPHQLKEGKDL
jgi:hypothetical protein